MSEHDGGIDPRAWGVDPGFHDAMGTWRGADPDAVSAVLGAMGADSPEPPPAAVMVVEAGTVVGVQGARTVVLEDGGTEDGHGDIDTTALPLGYHRVEGDSGSFALVLTPPACHLPAGLRSWGWAVQLYAARSRRSWGIGDLADLEELGRWSRQLGAGFLLVNPLHVAAPAQPSPYYPSSRCFLDPLYLRAGGEPPPVAPGATIDRRRAWAAKEPALRSAFDDARRRGHEPAFDEYREDRGGVLHRFAVHQALADHFGGPWTEWPEEYRHPAGAAVTAFAGGHAAETEFHEWLQWRLDEQLAAAASGIGLVHDLAVGCDPAGADTWLWPDAFAAGCRVGAPPDEFNTKGQDWGLPPYDPWRLRAAGYEPFVQAVRAGLRHGTGLRVDHVMGLFRLYWIPPGGSAADGVYVRYPADDLLGILCLESHRAGAFVVGEDLGTVEDSVREELARRRVLSYRLMWFEGEPPRAWPAQAMAAVTTHDLPTVAGLWTGEDLDELDRLGQEPNVEATRQIVERLGRWFGVEPSTPVPTVTRTLHAAVAEGPPMLAVATLDDAVGAVPRPNVPGTTDERPNWSIPLPRPIEELQTDPDVLALAELMTSARPPGRQPT